MKSIYIASSWKNQHAVELLTKLLRENGYRVKSFVEKAVHDEGRTNLMWDFEKWINSPDGEEKFIYDIEGAMQSDIVVYVGPSGVDAWAEVGAAYAMGTPVIGLYAKGEQSGLMRKMVTWVRTYEELLMTINRIE